jgi:hypothetical protein
MNRRRERCLTIVTLVFVLVVNGPICLSEVRLERLLHVRHVHALTLSQTVDDDRVAV